MTVGAWAAKAEELAAAALKAGTALFKEKGAAVELLNPENAVAAPEFGAAPKPPRAVPPSENGACVVCRPGALGCDPAPKIFVDRGAGAPKEVAPVAGKNEVEAADAPKGTAA